MREAVVLETAGPLRRGERGELTEAGIELGEYLGNNRYRALLPSEKAATELQESFAFIRGVEPIAVVDKIAPELRQGEVPDHARLADGRLKLHVELFESAQDEVRALLTRYAQAVRFNEQAGTWEVEVAPDQLEALAAEPAVKRIDPAPDPRLL